MTHRDLYRKALKLYQSDKKAALVVMKRAVKEVQRQRDLSAEEEYSWILGCMYSSAAAYGMALRWFQRHIQLNRESAHGHLAIGDCLKILGRTDEARPYLVEARRLHHLQECRRRRR